MFDPLIEAVLVMGPLKEIYYCNDSCVSLFDLPRKKLISGAPIYEMLSFSDPDLLITRSGTKGEKVETGYVEVKFTSKSGKSGLVQVLILPTQELFGRNKLWFVYFHDVSLEQRLHQKYVTQLKGNEKQKKLLDAPSSELSQKLLQLQTQLKAHSDTLRRVTEEISKGLELGELEIKKVKESIETLQVCSHDLKSLANQ